MSRSFRLRRAALGALLALALLPAPLRAQAPLFTLDSPNPESGGVFGWSVSGVPDADGDGRGDLLVGARLEDGGGVNAGRAYLFSGASGALLRTLGSPNPEGHGYFGYAVAGVADADGDGRGDLLVGASEEDGGTPDAGRVYLFSGATGAHLRTLTSPNPDFSGGFGEAVAGVPDADGDGRGDLLIGAQREDDDGRAYLFSGATGTLLHALTRPADGFGASVSGVPDVDGDGRGDLLVSDPTVTSGGIYQAGRAYVYSGATGALLRTLTSPNPRDTGRFGWSVSGVPDANGDGRGDLLVGTFGEYRTYLFSGTGVLLHTLAGIEGVVSGVPDADGDGRGDILVHASLFSGATGALLRTLTSPDPEPGCFGCAVSGVPDADGDSRGDLLIGAWSFDGGAMNTGRAYLFPSGVGSGITLTASGDPTTIPPGGAVTVTATVSNTTSQPAPLNLWVVVERAGNPVLTRLIGSGTLPAGATVTRSFALRAPGNTPPGGYTVVVNVGTYPNTPLASDTFDVTVTAVPGAAGAPAAEPFIAEALTGDVLAGDALARAPSTSAVAPSVAVSPNPFASRATVAYALPEAGCVRLAVYDLLGREVAVLVDAERAAGAHRLVLDVSALPAGVYVWRLTAGSEVASGRLTVAR